MSENKKSFWSGIPGLVTGLAGLLTGIVGLVTVLIQLNVIGGGSSDKTAATEPTTTVVPGSTALGAASTVPGNGSSGSTGTTILGSFVLSPKPLSFAPGDKTKTVTVKNTSSAAITIKPPHMTGPDAIRFSAGFDTCTSSPITPGLSCTLKVTFAPEGLLRTYTAKLQVEPQAGAIAGDEVDVSASTVL